MIILQANDVARRFSGVTFFEYFSLQIQDKSRIGLVGRNGAGKSTLLKMIIGETQPDEGTIAVKKGLKVAYLAQNAGLDSELSVYQEMLASFSTVIAVEKKMHQLETKIAATNDYQSAGYQDLLAQYDQIQHDFEAMNGYGYEATIRSVLHGFGFDESFYAQKVSALSGGQRTRLAIAKQLLEIPDLLVLDEPTNHLDMQTLAWLEKYLQNYQGALLIVSHDRYFLDRVVNEIYEVHAGMMDHYMGNYSRYIEQKTAKILAEQKAFDKQQTEIAKLEDFVNRNIVRASTTKRAQSRRKQLEKMTVLSAPTNESGVAHITFQAKTSSGNEVLQAHDVSLGYDAEQPLAQHINFDVKKQHAVALVGPNGVGKSTLIKTLLGQLPIIAGSFKIGANVTIGYYDQEQATLNPTKSLLNSVWDLHASLPEKDVRSILGSFMFTGEDVDKKVSALSGGEKARLLLTVLSMNEDNFLILDEPTNHLDIDSREVLETALNEFNGTIFFVSHDRYFINEVATEVLELSADGVTFFDGNYDYYLGKTAQINEQKEQVNQEKSRPLAETSYQANKAQQRELRQLERAVDATEQEMNDLVAQQLELTQQLNDPSIGSNLDKLQTINEQLQVIEQKLGVVEEHWTEASVALESAQNNH
ncbi:ABC-F family ATP-binding cassette domain-containing protein [Weissella diestrammenae]|uniref:ABC-F family ATP-binding cassette domain-containing protein n=1 Tax=Weissella diestrammenae TaxID=1162633 RepID=A0A7G9T686_9LACO|nr:ABC-F family ATP-binding cassette domain-containing protein [Weissella diestrammenae]MCM0583344.1 ABC-F family ATP-binding cassette domain-containing protein [Weissella diestrammenae]QNN75611.1 ABC-F family ATP-binding cassette domain-containing protein [Weissella diestrammenae]